MESEYFTNIQHIRDKKTQLFIDKHRCSIQKVTAPSSNTKTPLFKLVVDDLAVSRNNTYTICYECQTCDSRREITLNLYMRKVNKGTTRCDVCKNKREEKCVAQSTFMKEHMSTIIAGTYVKLSPRTKVKSMTFEQHIEKSHHDWEACDQHEFKENYFLRHLTIEEFERIRNKIISVNHDKLVDISEWVYFPTYRVYNQSQFTPMLIHTGHTCSEKPLYVKFKCENCDSEFIHRDLESVKNKHRILCQTCTLTNRVFRRRQITLRNGSTIMWQSIPERRFIEWCEEHNILVKNGPTIEYVFHDVTHKYMVDFELPNQQCLIEIKDNHCWHIGQVQSGKFGEKERAAQEWCARHHYTYHVVFPKTLQKMKDSILTSL